MKLQIKEFIKKLFKYITTEQPKELLVISLNNKYTLHFDVESLLFKIYELGEQPDLVYWKFIVPQAQHLIIAYKENEQLNTIGSNYK